MSKEISASQLMALNVTKDPKSPLNENQFESSVNVAHFPPPRTPLNAIADPAQYLEECKVSDFDSLQKMEAARFGRNPKCESSENNGNGCVSSGTPRVSGRVGKAHSEPNSGQSTPVRGYSRYSLGGSVVACTGSRAPQLTGSTSSRVSRGISISRSEPSSGIPHFELVEHPSFWTDHNVQVLIRIRPLSNVEKVSQGYDRCLRQESAQTMVWLGHPEARFTFDHIACETISQESLFKVAGLPMVDNCMSGYNSCMFAYGQTGSGKTYTMMGELFELEGELNIDRGLTPRIFEYLFSRIREEEEIRRDEKLQYSCKCSFLEIYNEQITDLLEPSSNNLLLREDLKKGVYVENLSEYHVMTVNDVVMLLLKGAANRKVSATYMNRESSRSHCVFTCIIESHWEKDSISHLRFSRLNLVDLAGSERQKTSGAEGDRLKEAANINKSLSTLGLVIMSLVDLAHGKHRHVPYRDSRLTFLLQDSLGGNSKTTIIANVSPSICSANETMSTLKFAQRAKMIQNNAVVNEDALVDITAPQWQIQESKMKCLEDALVGALRREKVAEIAIRKLEIEIERTNNLAFQHEEEVQSTNMILKLREEKIKQLELLLDGSLAAEKYLVQENEALLKEIQLLQERSHRNPELARLTFENTKLLEERQLFQSFYEQGERQALLDEVAKLRNQVLMMEHNEVIAKMSLQNKIEQVTRELEEARLCYSQYHEDQASQLSQEKEVDLVREQVEVETARTILQLQEEVGDLQLELHQRLSSMSQENSRLRTALCTKEKETMAQCIEWETATLELTNFIADSSRSIKDAYGHIEDITHSFPKVNVCLDEHIQRAASALLEKEETILLLQNSFENAQNMVREMESKLSSLKVAATAFNEIKEVNIECNEDGMSSKINILERELKYKEEQCAEAEKRADAALLVAKWSSDSHKVDSYVNFINRELQTSKLDNFPEMTRVNDKVKELEKVEVESDLIKLGVLEIKNVMDSYYKETEKYASTVAYYFNDMFSECKEIFQDLVTEAHAMRMQIKALKENRKCAEELIVKDNINKVENQSDALNQIRFELSRLNNSLTIFKSCMDMNYAVESKVITQGSVEVDTWSSNCSSPSSDSSTWCVAYNARKNVFLDGSCNNLMEGFVRHCQDVQGKPCFDSLNKKEVSCLRKEVDMMFNSFSKLHVQVAALSNGLDTLNDNSSEDLELGTSLAGRVESVEACAIDTKEVPPNEKIKDEVELLQKFEEAKMTIKEADAVLNTLVQAHENAKQLNCMWKQAGEKLLVERATLVKEVEQLKSMIDLKEGDNKSMQEQFLFTLKEIENAISLYEDCFSKLKREVEDKFSATYSDIVSMGNEMLKVLKNCQPSMEYIYSDFNRKEFAAFHGGERVHNIHSFNIGEPEQQKCGTMNKGFQLFCSNAKDDELVNGIKSEYDQGLSCANGKRTEENVALKKELLRKEVLLEGLLFDLSLLQESTSETKDMRDETEKINFLFSQVQHELELKTSQLDDMQIHQRKLKERMVDTEKALFLANSNLELANETVCTYSHQNIQLKMLLNDLYVMNSEIERQLEEKKELVNGLENEILHLSSSVDERILVSIESIENDLRRAISERDELSNEVCFLTDKLKLTYAFVDEKEAAAVVAHQDAETSKVYAEQKEEEVRVLEHSVEELENTINMLERKVYEMDKEVQQHRSIRDELEMELQDLRQRLMTVESFAETMDSKNANGVQAQEEISRKLRTKAMELFKAKNQIKILEEKSAEQDDELKNYRDYISELVLHSDAQATQYQQKYSNLEAMISEVSNRLSNPSSEITVDKSEKNPVRRRGSSSPFRCIASVMHQMNLEKDNELAVARLRIEELEVLAASQQKEVCILNTRIAATESMTHDVIRDLLGVKLDMTKYANLIEHYQVQKIVEEAHLHSQEFQAKELEVFNLKAKINELTEERESCEHVISKKEAEVISAQMNLERVRERDQLLCAQNEMLKMDNANLKRKTAELDEMVASLLGKQSTPHNVHQILKIKETDMLRIDNNELTIRLANSKKLLSCVNNEISLYLGPTIIADRNSIWEIKKGSNPKFGLMEIKEFEALWRSFTQSICIIFEVMEVEALWRSSTHSNV